MKRFAIFLVLMFGFCQQVAATRPLDNINIGDYVSLGNQQFIKLNNNGLLMMSATLTCPHGKIIGGKHVKCFNCPSDAAYDSTNVTCTCNDSDKEFDIDTGTCKLAGLPAGASIDTLSCSSPAGFMDSWDDCDNLQEAQTVCLIDRRDYRTYRVRKFTDGQCWMIDSLRFGGNYGETDGCSTNSGEGNFTYAWCGGNDAPGCTAGGSNSVAKAQETFASGYYGHCRAITGNFYYGPYNGYLYDWVAAMQSTLAYADSPTTFNDAHHQGICPSNWRLPTGTEYYLIYDDWYVRFADGIPDQAEFEFSGYAGENDGALNHQDGGSYYWALDGSALYFYTEVGSLYSNNSYQPHNRGLAVRCIKDE